MRIQNPEWAGQQIALRYAGTVVTCDETGCVDVPEKDAHFLLDTPGWLRPQKKDKAVATVSVVEPEPEPEGVEETEAEAEAEAEAEEGPNLEAMTKAELLATAEQYGVEVNDRATKAQLVETLTREIYGE